MKYLAVIEDNVKHYHALNVILESDLPNDAIRNYFEDDRKTQELVENTMGYTDGEFTIAYVIKMEEVPTYKLK